MELQTKYNLGDTIHVSMPWELVKGSDNRNYYEYRTVSGIVNAIYVTANGPNCTYTINNPVGNAFKVARQLSIRERDIYPTEADAKAATAEQNAKIPRAPQKPVEMERMDMEITQQGLLRPAVKAGFDLDEQLVDPDDLAIAIPNVPLKNIPLKKTAIIEAGEKKKAKGNVNNLSKPKGPTFKDGKTYSTNPFAKKKL